MSNPISPTATSPPARTSSTMASPSSTTPGPNSNATTSPPLSSPSSSSRPTPATGTATANSTTLHSPSTAPTSLSHPPHHGAHGHGHGHGPPPPAAAGAGPLPLHPTLPSQSTQTHITEARAALIASLSNLLDSELQSRASLLHANAAQLRRQERDVERATEGLRRENDKLLKVAREAGRTIKETGNVQNWAEVLERDFLVLEETVRLAGRGEEGDGGSEGSYWSGSGSYSGSSYSGRSDGEESEGDGAASKSRRGRLNDGDIDVNPAGAFEAGESEELVRELMDAMATELDGFPAVGLPGTGLGLQEEHKGEDGGWKGKGIVDELTEMDVDEAVAMGPDHVVEMTTHGDESREDARNQADAMEVDVPEVADAASEQDIPGERPATEEVKASPEMQAKLAT